MLLMADGSVCGPMCRVWKRYTEKRWIAEWCSRPGTRAAFTPCLTKEEALDFMATHGSHDLVMHSFTDAGACWKCWREEKVIRRRHPEHA